MTIPPSRRRYRIKAPRPAAARARRFVLRSLLAGIVAASPLCSGEAPPDVDTASAEGALFQGTPEEELGPTPWDDGVSIASNEARIDLFRNHIRDIGGGYLGIGGMQNLALASWADSEWIWLVDFTRRVVAANRIHIAFVRASPTPAAFRGLWSHRGQAQAFALIEREFGGARDFNKTYYRETWLAGMPRVMKSIDILERLAARRNFPLWLNDQGLYDRIRERALRGRVGAFMGSLAGPRTFRGAGDIARRMGVVFRVIYLSNAEEYLRDYPPAFRTNLTSLPVDGGSVTLRTLSLFRSAYPWATDSEMSANRGFHYNVMKAELFLRVLRTGYDRLGVYDIVKGGSFDGEAGFSLVTRPPIPRE